MKSFRRAFACEVDAVELDVHAVDSRLAVIHDSTVDRTTNGRGPVSGYSVANLKRLDAGDGEAIPLLEEVMEALPAEMGINIELKGPGTEKLVAATLHDAANTLVSSRDLGRLKAFDVRVQRRCARRCSGCRSATWLERRAKSMPGQSTYETTSRHRGASNGCAMRDFACLFSR